MSGQAPGTSLSLFDESYRRQGYRLIAGVDEAGRGPLAGPVVAASVVLHPDARPEGIDDSKKLSAKQRGKAFRRILDSSLAVGLGMVFPDEIDRINILQATFKAMNFAMCSLNQRPDIVLVDGNRVPKSLPKGFELKSVHSVVDGDSLSLSIAAASIIAKCFRDSMMQRYHQSYPDYGFDRHKGYGTKSHLAALMKYGPCTIHRKSFAPIKEMIGEQW
jgi:ribonuclease HII